MNLQQPLDTTIVFKKLVDLQYLPHIKSNTMKNDFFEI